MSQRGFVKTKKVITVAVLTVLVAASIVILPTLTQASWFSNGKGTWNYRQKITLNHKQVNQATKSKTPLANFPVLISTTNVQFKSLTNGGHVGLDTGYDIVFTTGDGKTKLAHEIEKYDATTGQIIAWVKVPSLSPTTDTTIYMYYGNAAETGNEQNATGVWDSNYQSIYHLGNGTSLSVSDSKNAHNATNNGPVTATTGRIDGAANGFNSTGTKYIDTGYPMLSTTDTAAPYTVSLWFSNVTNTVDLIGQFVSGDAGRTTLNKAGSVLIFTTNGGARITGTKTVNDGSMHYVTLIKDSSKIVTMYVDGVQDGNTYTNNATASNVNTWIGRGFYYFTGGIIDEVRFSSTARTADWIKTEYNNQNSPSTFAVFNGEETQPTAQVKGGWYNSSWAYRKKLTIDKTKVSTVSGTTNTNFPVLVSMTDASLKSVANGGHMASTTASNAADLVFTDSSGTVKLNHEIEKYDPATGQIIAWVQLPTLAPATDTDIYLYYGNSSVSVSQANPSGVWSNGYGAVWHFKEVAGSNRVDSVNNISLIPTGTTAPAGKINGGVGFNGTTDKLVAVNTSILSTMGATHTSSAWVFLNSFGGSSRGRIWDHGAVTFYVDNSNLVKGLSLYSNINATSNANSIDTGAWYYITVTYDFNNSYATSFYVNGVAKGTGIVNYNLNDSSDYFTVGSRNLDNARGFDGTMSELKISNVVRTPDWIATEYNNQSDQTIGSGHFYKAKGSEETVPNSNWYQAWGYRKKVIINHTQVSGTSTLAAFPVLVSVTSDQLLKSVANGGHMASTTAADLMFTSADGSTKIPHEIEKYDPATGQLIAWVKTNVSPTTDTILYMYYGNPDVTVSQEDKTNVWSNGYAGVYHLPNNPTLSANDSTGLNNGTLSGEIGIPTATTGQIDGAMNVTTSQWVQFPANSANSAKSQTAMTVQGWVKFTGAGTTQYFYDDDTGSSYFRLALGRDSTNCSGAKLSFITRDTSTGDTGTSEKLCSVTTVNTDTWYFVVGAYSSSASSKTIYLNGILDNSTSVSVNPFTSTDSAISSLSVYSNAESFYRMAGNLDEARISTTVRTPDWIKTEYNNQSAPTSFVTLAGEESSIKTTVNTTWYSSDWTNRKKITIDHRKVSGSTALTDFPVLISLTDAQLKSTGNGGLVASTTGADILFTSSDGKTKLNHEIESYNSATGQLIAWVKISSLSPSADTSVYLYFGNSVVTTMQANPTGVWDANYKGVWHLGDVPTTARDSTGVNNATSIGSTIAQTAGKIDGSASFDGSTNASINAGTSSSLDAGNLTGKPVLTLQAWVKRSAINTSGSLMGNPASSIGGYFLGLGYSAVSNGYNCTNTQVGFTSIGMSGVCAGNFPADTNLHKLDVTSNSSGLLSVYVDGSLTGTANDANVFTSGSSIFGIGYYPQNTLYYQWNGVLDEVRMSNTARTADWIKTEYNNQSSPKTFYAVGALEVENRPAGTAGEKVASRGAGNWTVATGNWTNRREITVNYNKMGHTATTTLYGFPMLFSSTNNEFKYGSGGKMGKSDGTDIFFTLSDGKTKLAHELEKYDGSTGTVIAWVNIPILTKGTVIYMYYGNATSPDMQTVAPVKTAVWDSNYKGVWHLGDNAANTTVKDSTGVLNLTSTVNTVTNTVAGKIGNALFMNAYVSLGSKNYAKGTSASVSFPVTVSGWFYLYDTGNAGGGMIFGEETAGSNNGFRISVKNIDRELQFTLGGSANYDFTNLKAVNMGLNYFSVTVNGNNGAAIGYLASGSTMSSQTLSIGSMGTGFNEIGLGGSTKWLFNSVLNLDEIRFSNIARTDDWIKTEYNNQSSPSTFYTLGPSNPVSRPASKPLLKSRGGVQLR